MVVNRQIKLNKTMLVKKQTTHVCKVLARQILETNFRFTLSLKFNYLLLIGSSATFDILLLVQSNGC